jgi:hypothetical protein
MTTSDDRRIWRFCPHAAFIFLLSFGALLLFADDIPAKLLGEWSGSHKYDHVYATFTKRSVRLAFDTCIVSGSYKISSQDELLLTPSSLDPEDPCSRQLKEFSTGFGKSISESWNS